MVGEWVSTPGSSWSQSDCSGNKFFRTLIFFSFKPTLLLSGYVSAPDLAELTGTVCHSWDYTFVPSLSSSVHPVVLREPLWLRQACSPPSCFDAWLLWLCRDNLVSKTTSAMPFLWTSERSSRHLLNHPVSRAAFREQCPWLQLLRRPFSIETGPSFVALTFLFLLNSFPQVLSHSGLLSSRFVSRFQNPSCRHSFQTLSLGLLAC